MNAGKDDLQEKLRLLEKMFLDKLPARMAEMEAALVAYEAEPENMQHLVLLHRLLHTIAGSSGTFGFDDLGDQARKFEHRLNPVIAAKAWVSEAFSQFSKEVRDYFAQGLQDAQHQGNSEQMQESVNVDGEFRPKLIYFLGADTQEFKALQSQLTNFGYDLICIADSAALNGQIAKRRPDVILFESSQVNQAHQCIDLITQLKANARFKIPCILLSDLSDFEHRLQAVKAGADAFFNRPVDVLPLHDKIETLLQLPEQKSYRVLVVDDDKAGSDYAAIVLKNAGFVANTVRHPEQILRALIEFRAEVLLINIDMESCSGFDLSRLIRQDPAYFDIPIIFYAKAEQADRKITALEAGGDDLLLKPLLPDLLSAAINARAERYRAQHALVIRDGLTSLLNHTAIEDELRSQLAIAGRNHHPLSLAMIDLDFFKRVNDTYGHSVGDQVLRSLARVLKLRLRRSDIVGRFGGEEFVIIFPATEAQSAHKVLDQIRLAFEKLQHKAASAEFNVTFSAGIVDSSKVIDPNALIELVDSALYQAKNSGRNRIVLAESESEI